MIETSVYGKVSYYNLYRMKCLGVYSVCKRHLMHNFR